MISHLQKKNQFQDSNPKVWRLPACNVYNYTSEESLSIFQRDLDALVEWQIANRCEPMMPSIYRLPLDTHSFGQDINTAISYCRVLWHSDRENVCRPLQSVSQSNFHSACSSKSAWFLKVNRGSISYHCKKICSSNTLPIFFREIYCTESIYCVYKDKLQNCYLNQYK